ncbi:MAG TPA: tetratricopeptide repeat protein [Lunatimonas sp.]|nr:tetratricopeptide repeat protein [Lunatimonas sp.]
MGLKKLIVVIIGTLLIASCDSAESKKGRFLLKGNAKLQEGDIQGAINFYEEALKLDGEFADAYYNRGLAYIRLANFPKAIEDFSSVFEIQPTNYDALYQRAISHLDFGENYRALGAAEK